MKIKRVIMIEGNGAEKKNQNKMLCMKEKVKPLAYQRGYNE